MEGGWRERERKEGNELSVFGRQLPLICLSIRIMLLPVSQTVLRLSEGSPGPWHHISASFHS